MKYFRSTEELLDFAIREEEASASFYKHMAGKMKQPYMRKTFEEFSIEEEGHKAKLLSIKSNKLSALPEQEVLDLRIGDYLDDAKLNADMDYQEALILAMKKEKAAFRMYSDLSSVVESEDIRNLLLSLAQEEARHKLRFEVEYDDVILREN